MKQSTSLLSATFHKEEVFLDILFNNNEVEHAVNKMKLKKSAGPDDLTAEHLKYGGQSIIMWLTGILNLVWQASFHEQRFQSIKNRKFKHL